MVTAVQAALATFIATVLLCPLTLLVLRKFQIIDRPTSRSSHTHETPRAGGIAPAVASLVALPIVSGLAVGIWMGLFVASLSFAVLGLIGDLMDLPPLVRLALQFAAAILALPWILIHLSGPSIWQGIFILGVFMWLVAFVNAFNFMDGANGMSVAQVMVAGLTWYGLGHWHGDSALSSASLIAVAAAAAFGPFNFPRARMFLGDVGSYFFGAWLAVLLVAGLREGLPAEAMLAPLSLYLADTATTLARRVSSGESWYQPHRQHAYQQLIQLGWSHARTTLVIGGAMLACAGLGLLSVTGVVLARVAGDALLVLILASYVMSPKLLARLGKSSLAAP